MLSKKLKTQANKKAGKNLLALANNSYPGRGIVIGTDRTGEYLVQVYWIMGRSPGSQNRIFIYEDDKLKTELARPDEKADTSLIIYTAMAQLPGIYAVSNGHQTEDILKYEKAYEFDLASFLQKQGFEYEPDPPNYTPRISAISILEDNKIYTEIASLSKSSLSDDSSRASYRYKAFPPGFGCCITTYSGDGNPLPSFIDEPYLLPLIGDIKNVAKTIWNNLNEDNRVALATKFINIKTREVSIEVINKHRKVIAPIL